MEYERCIEVIALSADAARAFFGFDPNVRAVDGGPPIHNATRFEPGARVWLLYPDDRRRLEIVK